MSATRKMHNALESSRRDMLAQCQSGDEFACRYLIDHDAAEHIQPEQHVERPYATVIAGAVVVWLLVMAFFNIPIWSN
jgi:protein tyrosine phosphatase (PTP) superfamily phosphohydrolase (DUF442 family)